jgi:hypothetical protein
MMTEQGGFRMADHKNQENSGMRNAGDMRPGQADSGEARQQAGATNKLNESSDMGGGNVGGNPSELSGGNTGGGNSTTLRESDADTLHATGNMGGGVAGHTGMSEGGRNESGDLNDVSDKVGARGVGADSGITKDQRRGETGSSLSDTGAV